MSKRISWTRIKAGGNILRTAIGQKCLKSTRGRNVHNLTNSDEHPISIVFNIFWCDLFYFLDIVTVTSYSDDTKPYRNLEKEHLSKILFHWFDFNYLKVNIGNRHMFFSGHGIISLNIDSNIIKSENKNKLLGIVSHSKLSFEASQKLIVLTRFAPYMYLKKKNRLKHLKYPDLDIVL